MKPLVLRRIPSHARGTLSAAGTQKQTGQAAHTQTKASETPTINMTLYAQWRADGHDAIHVEFDDNGSWFRFGYSGSRFDGNYDSGAQGTMTLLTASVSGVFSAVSHFAFARNLVE